LGISIPEAVLETIEYRVALLSLDVIMVIGFAIYRKVPDRGRHIASGERTAK
jgi:hypothetical protein